MVEVLLLKMFLSYHHGSRSNLRDFLGQQLTVLHV